MILYNFYNNYSITYLNLILFRFIKEKLQPVVNSEEQLIYACHLIGPTLARFNAERPNCVVELTVRLYEMLEQVDRLQTHLKYMDPVCDLLYPFNFINLFLYHCSIKYFYYFLIVNTFPLILTTQISYKIHVRWGYDEE